MAEIKIGDVVVICRGELYGELAVVTHITPRRCFSLDTGSGIVSGYFLRDIYGMGALGTSEPVWIVVTHGNADEYEISVVLSTDNHGIRSCGWDSCSKIILFSSGSHNSSISFADGKKYARALCKAMNRMKK
jgi:hypothetical protein